VTFTRDEARRIARAAYVRAVEAGLDVEPLLKKSGLTVQQAEDPLLRIAVESQIKFLNLVADALADEFLGAHLAEQSDLRELGDVIGNEHDTIPPRRLRRITYLGGFPVTLMGIFPYDA
jgi:hypothetical protein